VRFRKGGQVGYGILDGATVRELKGELFGQHKPGNAHRLADVKLLYPCEPPKILAVGLNYKSHLGTRTPPAQPEIFYKPVTCLTHPGDPIVIPPTAKNVHYEGELVIVIGKRASKVSAADARDVIFGVTCGNDVSERDWQNGAQKDLQWWRAKGADTFGPLGPAIVRGLDFGKLDLQTRVNGQVVQKSNTSDLPLHRQLHQPVRHPDPRRRDLHGHSRHDQTAQVRRHRGGGDRGPRDAAQSSSVSS
jgi:2-keto-4-pentenoate hydratase/2-oxohepta-3-ene-1,7-dioic acid hydratase in catechol pathway